MLEAFLLTRGHRDTRAGTALEFWASTARGPVLMRIPEHKPVLFLPRSAPTFATTSGVRKPLELKSLAGEPVDGVYFDTQRELVRERDRLREAGQHALEADVQPADRYLMERFITGSCMLEGELVPRHGYLELMGGTLRTLESAPPKLRSLALDIETDGLHGALFSVAFVCDEVERVLMIGRGEPSAVVRFHATEAELLTALVQELRALDPDLILGWNVIDYDLAYLIEHCRAAGVGFDIGRDGSAAELSKGNVVRLRCAGRVALDGVDVLRASSMQFESYALDDVAQQLLGRGKAIDHEKLDRVAEIRRMYHEAPDALARYNLEDCRLTLDIFAKADLIGFLVERQQLTGLPFDRARGMVAAFDYLYLPRLHRAGYVAPSVGDAAELGPSPGGYVMDSLPGLYDNVIVLDFKSLYPSIIRTFCIDPLALAVADDDAVQGFAGARFHRERHILPGLITTLWQARDEAKRRKDAARSYAIKILMNSFYGVLGTPGCRFFNPQLASSITLRGHEIITRSRAELQARGLTVIYGDTDSLFVLLGAALSADECRARGTALALELNEFWRNDIAAKHRLESRLEIQFDTHYRRFFMPTLRDSERGSKKRYAGLARDRDGHESLVFKGLEAVRTDWTPLARRFQRELYRRIFAGEPYEDFILEITNQLTRGELDAELIYRKRVRRPLDEYVKNVPPHVQAARQLSESTRVVSYYMTVRGPEPVGQRSSPLDYRHYLERQLAPAADAILQHCGTDFMRIAGRQLSLF